MTAVLGAPGIRVLAPEPVLAITGVRRDVAAFAGVAPRGPAREPAAELLADGDLALWLAGPVSRSVAVPVTSWDEYRYAFGGFEGPGRLPYAVSAFFAQGGERAWVVRVVHGYGTAADEDGRAAGPLGTLVTTGGDAVELAARSEGSWGNRLRAVLSFAARPVPVLSATTGELIVSPDRDTPAGSVVRVRLPGDVLVLRYVERVDDLPDPDGPGMRRHLLLDLPLASAPSAFDLVTGTLAVVDPDPLRPRAETLTGLGLRADHPRWLGRALATGSALLRPLPGWAAGPVDLAGIDPTLPAVEAVLAGGDDRWADVVPEDFWDPAWVPGDERPGVGVHCLAENDEIGLLVVPDLYDPAPLAPVDDVGDPPSVAGPDFALCLELEPPGPPPEPPPPGMTGLALDPLVVGDYDRIVTAQQALVALASVRDLTVLLDVPLGLPHRRVLRWRASFDSPYAAAYHPWLDVAAPDDARDTLVRMTPSAFAAGIVADRERRLGVQVGPGNQVAVGPVRVSTVVTADQHHELHPDGINVFVSERDGIRLTAARTLSRRGDLRQLSVARLLTVLRLSLQRELDWAVFEPNDDALWAQVRRLVAGYLTRLYAAGAFTGDTAKEGFFVRCDRSTMTPNDLDNGRFVCLVGIAPAEPLEYLVLRITRDRDDTVRAEVAGTAG